MDFIIAGTMIKVLLLFLYWRLVRMHECGGRIW